VRLMVHANGIDPHLMHQLEISHGFFVLILHVIPVFINPSIIRPVDKAVSVQILGGPILQSAIIGRFAHAGGKIRYRLDNEWLIIYEELPIAACILNQSGLFAASSLNRLT